MNFQDSTDKNTHQNKNIIHRCKIDEDSKHLKTIDAPELDSETKKRRRLDEFQDFHIFIDDTYLKYQAEGNQNLSYILPMCQKAMKKVIDTISKLLKVKRVTRNYKITPDKINGSSMGIFSYNETIVSENTNSSLGMLDLGYDLIIFPKFTELDEGTLATAGGRYMDDNYRPYIGICNINKDIDLSVNGSQMYLESILLHEFTHVLGFIGDYFQNYFPGHPWYNATDEFGFVRTYFSGNKLLEVARKYYNCPTLEGLELENQGGEGTQGSHWEARLVLGDYMGGVVHPEEQVISEFTLALLEDSGWYQANYYTGGLMRYGKNQGCGFLKNRCIKNKKSISKNDFFEFWDYDKNAMTEIKAYGNHYYYNNIGAMCTSGRQSRAYSGFKLYNENLGNYSYYDNKNIGFYFETADYCPVAIEYTNDLQYNHYVGHCQHGNGNYGSLNKYPLYWKEILDSSRYSIHYGTQYIKNGELPQDFGEEYSENSFCVLTTLMSPAENQTGNYTDIIRAQCQPMFCSSSSLTIKINGRYIVCPKEGGKIQFKDLYEGYLLCPDYNLICTGTVMCNDMWDCVEKQSLPKEETFNYDYISRTSQIIREEHESTNVYEGYEMSTDGKCPQFCNNCDENKNCFKSLQNCTSINNCEKCSSNLICEKCNIGYVWNGSYCSSVDDQYYFENGMYKKCSNAINNCKKCHNKTSCYECEPGYSFVIGLENNKCYLSSLYVNNTKFFTLDNGRNYKSCINYHNISHCLECSSSTICLRCDSGFAFLDGNKNKCINISDYGNSIYKEDDINYKSCSSINNCITCYNSTRCETCKNGFANYLGECLSISNPPTGYFAKNNNTFEKCENKIRNCSECTIDGNECIKCNLNFSFVNYNKRACISDYFLINNDSYFQKNQSNYLLCSQSSVNNCEKCLSSTECKKCQSNYTIVDSPTSSFCENKIYYMNNDSYFTDDYGEHYYSCNHWFTGCVRCNNNYSCSECDEISYTLLEGDSVCSSIALLGNKYYKDNNNTYQLCSKGINNCEACENETYCSMCKSGYSLLDNNNSQCYSVESLKYFSVQDPNNINSYSSCYNLMEHCEQCNNSYHCEQCQPGYGIIDSYMYYNNSICVPINNSYYLDNDGIYKKCKTSLPNCETCIDSNNCLTCEVNYILFLNQCIERNKPPSGHFVNNDTFKRCNSTLYNCENCTINGENCTACNYGFMILNDDYSRCYSKSQYSSNKYYHSYDEKYYYSCNYSIPNCQECSSSNQCTKCQNSFTLINVNNNSLKCEEKINYQNDPHYYTDDWGVSYHLCKDKLVGCDTCILNGTKCTSCNNQSYILINNETSCRNKSTLINKYFKDIDGLNKLCHSGVNNCEECSSKYNCTKCIDNYTLLDNNLSYCYPKYSLNNLALVDINNPNNYKSCKSFIKNCYSCSSIDNCTSCESGYGFINGDISSCHLINNSVYLDHDQFYLTCNSAPNMTFCKKCSNSSNCLECQYDYILFKSKCYDKNDIPIDYFYNGSNFEKCSSRISNCYRCDSNGTKCNECYENFAILNNDYSKCLNKNQFYGNHYYNLSSQSFYSCNFSYSNCEECNQNECTKCENNWVLFNNNSTSSCKLKNLIQNNNSYYTPDNLTYYSCDYNIPGCKRCNNNGSKCLECDNNGFALLSGEDKCTPKANLANHYFKDNYGTYKLCKYGISNCEECNGEYNCIKCFSNYTLLNNNHSKCYLINDIKNISLQDLNNSNTYTSCNNFIYNCQSCSDRNTCKLCEQGYGMINNDSRYCIPINNTYFLDNDGYHKKCFSKMINCKTCSNANTCNSCLNGFILFNNSCYSNNTSPDGYYLDVNQFLPCSNKIYSCAKCSLSGDDCYQCSNNKVFLNDNHKQCIDTYYLNNYSYYSLNSNNYYSCNYTIYNCSKCNNSSSCYQCDNLTTIVNKLADNQCYPKINYINDKNYYTNDSGIHYFFCNLSIEGCNECDNNGKICTKCDSRYYGLVYNTSKCLKYEQLSEYYYKNETDEKYYYCNNSIDHCLKCNNSRECTECNSGFKFLDENWTHCFRISEINNTSIPDTSNPNNYKSCNRLMTDCNTCKNNSVCTSCSSGGIIYPNLSYCQPIPNYTHYRENNGYYYKCDTNMPQCKECYGKNSCFRCDNDYVFLDRDTSKCHSKNSLNNKALEDKTDSKYYISCNRFISNCDSCSSNDTCITCFSNYTLVESKSCILINSTNQKQYYNVGGNYFKCSRAIKNCLECEGPSKCTLCEGPYGIIDDNFTTCVQLSTLDMNNYYSLNPETKRYYSCSRNQSMCKKDNNDLINGPIVKADPTPVLILFGQIRIIGSKFKLFSIALSVIPKGHWITVTLIIYRRTRRGRILNSDSVEKGEFVLEAKTDSDATIRKGDIVEYESQNTKLDGLGQNDYVELATDKKSIENSQISRVMEGIEQGQEIRTDITDNKVRVNEEIDYSRISKDNIENNLQTFVLKNTHTQGCDFSIDLEENEITTDYNNIQLTVTDIKDLTTKNLNCNIEKNDQLKLKCHITEKIESFYKIKPQKNNKIENGKIITFSTEDNNEYHLVCNINSKKSNNVKKIITYAAIGVASLGLVIGVSYLICRKKTMSLEDKMNIKNYYKNKKQDNLSDLKDNNEYQENNLNDDSDVNKIKIYSRRQQNIGSNHVLNSNNNSVNDSRRKIKINSFLVN